MATRADEYLVALDLGTSGLKVAVTTPRGEIAGSVQERYPLHVLGGGVHRPAVPPLTDSLLSFGLWGGIA